MTKKKTAVGPGMALINMYVAQDEKKKIRMRAKSLGLTASAYLRRLADNDISTGGNFVLRDRGEPNINNIHPA